MPITQDRMLSLISAARAYQDALDQCGHDLARVQSGQLHIALAIAQYQSRLSKVVLHHLSAIEREDAHFAAWRDKNYRTAKRLADKRRQNRPEPDWKAATIAHNKIVGNAPTRDELEQDVEEFFKQLEIEENMARTNASKSPANELQSEANPLETLDKTNSEQPGNKR